MILTLQNWFRMPLQRYTHRRWSRGAKATVVFLHKRVKVK